MEKGAIAFSKSNLMVTKKVRQISGNAPTGEVKLEILLCHSSARRVTWYISYKMERSCSDLLFFLLFSRCPTLDVADVVLICKLVPTEAVSPLHSSVMVAVLRCQRCWLSLRLIKVPHWFHWKRCCSCRECAAQWGKLLQQPELE